MKANELKVADLMVGDLVLHDGKVIRVDAVHKRKIGYHKTKDKLTWLFSGQFEPIPLTPDILEKNGFENIDNKYPFPTFRCDDKENYLCITIGFPEGDKTKRKRPFIEIDGVNIYIGHLIINFVHELQHALKLCGIDKEIIV